MPNTYFRAAVGAFIVNEEGKLLIILKHGYKNKWDVVKGGISEGETETTALKRELEEELGINNSVILNKSLISSVKINSNSDRSKQEYIGQARNHYWVFVSNKYQFNIPNEEIEKFKWIKIRSKDIEKYFGIHDEERVLQTLLPIEWKSIKHKIFSNRNA